MIQRFDHVTVVVRDLEGARRFFGLLGFAEDKAVVIKGPVMDAYMYYSRRSTPIAPLRLT